MSRKRVHLLVVSCLALLATTPVLGADSHTRLPLFFTPVLDGQFTASGAGYRIDVRGAAFAINTPGGPRIRWRFEHANPSATPRGTGPLSGVVNRVRGTDRRLWQMNLPAFSGVAVDAIYPGVDLVCYGTEGKIEYDLRLAPYAEPSKIRTTISGARQISVDAKGALVICTAAGCLRQPAPRAYQEHGGRRRSVDAAYDVRGDHVRFRLGAYDRSVALIIDPVLDYSTYVGGSAFEGASGIAVDSAGNMLVTGQTQSSDFPLVNAQDTTYAGFSEAFVVKLNPAGQLVYATYFGGSGDDTPTGIAVDSAGNAYIVGNTTSADFPIADGFDSSLASFRDAYVFVLSPSGSLLHSTYLGGNDEETARAIAVDSTGRVIVTGETSSTNFPTTSSAFDTTYGGSGDVFISVLNGSLSALVYSTYFGGSGNDNAAGVAVDASGNILVAGLTSSVDFPVLNAFDTTLNGVEDAFVLKLTPTGSLVFSTLLGGASVDEATGIATDAAGAVYVTGQTQSADFPVTPGAFDTTYGGFGDAFVTKLDAAGALDYSTFLGGQFSDSAASIATNTLGNAFVTGMTSGFPLVQPIDNTLGGTADAFVAELTPSGGALVFSTYLGGANVDTGTSIVAVGQIAYVAGTTLSSDFPRTPNASDQTLGGTHDAFVVRIVITPAPTTTTLGSTPNPSFQGESVTLTAVVTEGGGTMTFRDGGTVLAVVPIAGGAATLLTSTLSLGLHNLDAIYSGDATHAGSTSNVVVHSVVSEVPFGPPTNLQATGTSGPQVNVTWTPVANADHYEVWRASATEPFTMKSLTPSAAYLDQDVVPNHAYAYKVLAVNASNVKSAFGATDLATTVSFTDDPLIGSSTLVKADHLNELALAVNAVQSTAGQMPTAFTDSPFNSGGMIRGYHICQLRAALTSARAMIGGLPATSYTDVCDSTNLYGVTIKAVHVQEIRGDTK